MTPIYTTKKEYLARHAAIMELRFGRGWSVETIARVFKTSHYKINWTCAKYFPKQTGKDIVLTIGSRLNYDQEIEEPELITNP